MFFGFCLLLLFLCTAAAVYGRAWETDRENKVVTIGPRERNGQTTTRFQMLPKLITVGCRVAL